MAYGSPQAIGREGTAAKRTLQNVGNTPLKLSFITLDIGNILLNFRAMSDIIDLNKTA